MSSISAEDSAGVLFRPRVDGDFLSKPDPQLRMFYYKYLPPERIDVLRDLSIRFTQPSAQNDPFEFRPISGFLLRHADYLRTLASDLPLFFDTLGESNYLVDDLKSDLKRDRGDAELDLGLAFRVPMIMKELGVRHWGPRNEV